MRTFRNAALAAATATAMVLGGTTVATAQEGNGTSSTFTSGSSKFKEQDGNPKLTELSSALFQPNGIHQVGKLTGAKDDAKLTDLFGAQVNDSETPVWALMWRDALNWVGLAAGIGLIIAAANAALHEGLLPQIPW